MRGGPRWQATGDGQSARPGEVRYSGSQAGSTTGGKLATEGSAALRSCAARQSWQVCVGSPSSRLAACSTACTPVSN